jgi:hypothetical protein
VRYTSPSANGACRIEAPNYECSVDFLTLRVLAHGAQAAVPTQTYFPLNHLNRVSLMVFIRLVLVASRTSASRTYAVMRAVMREATLRGRTACRTPMSRRLLSARERPVDQQSLQAEQRQSSMDSHTLAGVSAKIT